MTRADLRIKPRKGATLAPDSFWFLVPALGRPSCPFCPWVPPDPFVFKLSHSIWLILFWVAFFYLYSNHVGHGKGEVQFNTIPNLAITYCFHLHIPLLSYVELHSYQSTFLPPLSPCTFLNISQFVSISSPPTCLFSCIRIAKPIWRGKDITYSFQPCTWEVEEITAFHLFFLLVQTYMETKAVPSTDLE